MAMKAIQPRTDALRYASHQLDDLRSLFAEIENRKDVSEGVYKIAKRGRAKALSARVTIDIVVDELARPLPPPPEGL